MFMVQVTVNLPDSLAALLVESHDDLEHRVLEDVIAEACRSGRVSRADAAAYLNHESWSETEEFLARHEIPLAYNRDDLAHDLAVMDKLFPVK